MFWVEIEFNGLDKESEEYRIVGRCKYKVLHLAGSNQHHRCKMGSEWLCNSQEEDLGVIEDHNFHMGQYHAAVKKGNCKLVWINKSVTCMIWSFICSQQLLAKLHVSNRILRNGMDLLEFTVNESEKKKKAVSTGNV